MMTHTTRIRPASTRFALACGALALLLMGCGEEDAASSKWNVREGAGDQTEYGSDEGTVVITPGRDVDESYVVSGEPGDQCVEIEDRCVPIEDAKARYCEDGGPADVIVVDGEVVDVICYPDPASGQPIEEAVVASDGGLELPQNKNGSVITFGPESDGVPFEGDVALEAERTVIYGRGIDETIFEGSIKVASNNSRIRGVTVNKDVVFQKNSNNSKISFTRILGNLKVESNGFSGANLIVFGDVSVKGNDAVLTNVAVQGAWDVSNSAACYGCYSFDDTNDDLLIDDDERGDDLLCGGGGSSTPQPVTM